MGLQTDERPNTQTTEMDDWHNADLRRLVFGGGVVEYQT